MTPPTIAETYTAKRAAFIRHVPFGVLLKRDEADLIRATARDCGVTIPELMQVLGDA